MIQVELVTLCCSGGESVIQVEVVTLCSSGGESVMIQVECGYTLFFWGE